jgi:serine/threonine protein kinase
MQQVYKEVSPDSKAVGSQQSAVGSKKQSAIGSRQSAMFMIGQTVSHYRILSELGAGGMGVVYLANDTVLKRRVAIKMLNAKHFSHQNQQRSRLLREARAVSQINHPNIATVYDYGETEDGQPFIVMEYVDGESLCKLIERKVLTIERTVEIMGAVAAALAEAHRHGIIHRDIKPSNIVLSRRNEVKVLDFGLAKQLEDETLSPDDSTAFQSAFATETRKGAVLGTPLYLSPEQATGTPVDERSDIFSLGSVLYECLTGQPPFHAQSSIEICARILRDDPPPPSEINPEITAELDRVVSKALTKDINQRYQSAKEFAQDLGFRDFKKTADELSHPVKSPTDETKKKVETVSADGVGTKGKRHGSTAEESKHFSLSFDGLQNMWSGIGSFGKIIFLSLVFSLTCTLGYVGYRVVTKPPTKDITQSLQFQRLPISGNIKEAIISPNGEYVASIVEEKGKQSIQLSDSSVSSDVRIYGPVEKQIKGLSFSLDSNYIYYLDYEGDTGTLYYIPKLGGVQRKLVSNINTPVTFSPDGKRMAFIRYNTKERTTKLITASSDGSDEKIISTRKFPEEYTLGGPGDSIGPVWSPNGEQIACSVNKKTEQGATKYIEAVSHINGSSKPIGNKSWHKISKMAWVADGSGLVISTVERMLLPNQLHFLSYPNGDINRITLDPSSYLTVSATKDSKILLSLKSELSSIIWIMPSNDVQSSEQLSFTYNKGIREIAWLSNESLLYALNDESGTHIFAEKLDGGSILQLTFNEGDFIQPVVSHDQRFVFLTSNKAGLFNLWRIDADGTNQVQLTKVSNADSPSISPDGKWVYYHGHSKDRDSVWRVSAEGGNPELFINQNALYPTVSPDGKMIAFFTWDSSSPSLKLSVHSINDGKEIKLFSLPSSVSLNNRLRWLPDGEGIAYVVKDSAASNIWTQLLDGTSPEPLTNFKESDILDFAWSPDGQKIACVRGMKITNAVVIKNLPWE